MGAPVALLMLLAAYLQSSPPTPMSKQEAPLPARSWVDMETFNATDTSLLQVFLDQLNCNAEPAELPCQF